VAATWPGPAGLVLVLAASTAPAVPTLVTAARAPDRVTLAPFLIGAAAASGALAVVPSTVPDVRSRPPCWAWR